MAILFIDQPIDPFPHHVISGDDLSELYDESHAAGLSEALYLGEFANLHLIVSERGCENTNVSAAKPLEVAHGAESLDGNEPQIARHAPSSEPVLLANLNFFGDDGETRLLVAQDEISFSQAFLNTSEDYAAGAECMTFTLPIDPGWNSLRHEGGSGTDILQGGIFSEELIGRGGRDFLFGHGGKDLLNGGKGRDTLNGGKGNDRLKGGAGQDRFVFEKRDGNDVVLDFEDDVDQIEISASLMGRGAKSIDRLIQEFGSQSTDDVVLDFGRRGEIEIRDTTLAELTDDILIF